MAPLAILSVLTVLLIVGLALGLEIAFTMGIVGAIGLFFWHFGVVSLVAIGDISWEQALQVGKNLSRGALASGQAVEGDNRGHAGFRRKAKFAEAMHYLGEEVRAAFRE